MTQAVQYFPRLTEDAELAARRKHLEEFAWQLISTRRKVRIELGRIFIKIKETFPHGGWQPYYEKTFEKSTHASLRTVQRWMDLARKTDSESENDNLSVFQAADDSEAVRLRNKTASAEADVRKRSMELPTKASVVYRLPLELTTEERSRTDQLRKSPKWSQAEAKVVNTLNALFIEFVLVDSDAAETEHENSLA